MLAALCACSFVQQDLEKAPVDLDVGSDVVVCCDIIYVSGTETL